MEEVAKRWLKKKVSGEIIGICCDISNMCGHKYPFTTDIVDRISYYNGIGTYRDVINGKLSTMSMLFFNFQDYINIETIIDDYFIEDKKLPIGKQSHWGTESHIKVFKCLVNESKLLMRDRVLSNILQ